MDILLGGLGLERFKLQNPFAVANFIIDMAIEKDKPVTNLKLQKIMFFLQGYCLSKYNTPLIDGSFSKWRYGPVEEDVYRNFKNNGAIPITYEYKVANIKDGIIHVHTVKMDNNILNSNVVNDFKKIVGRLVAIEPWKLVEMTHSHSSWKDYVDEINVHKAKDYTDEEIKACFVDNKSELGVNRTMQIVKGLSRNKIIGSGDVIKILFIDAENEEALFVEKQECYVIVVHNPGVGKYHLINLESGTIVFSIDFDKDICDELNKSFGTWEVVDAELNVSK